MSLTKEIIEHEASMMQDGERRVIHLHREGTFYRAYEWSAYLSCRFLHDFKVNKRAFKNDIQEFERNGGSMSFSFGETKLPVINREALNLLCVKMPTTEVFIPVDYRLDFSDNANMLMEKLLQNYPELQE